MEEKSVKKNYFYSLIYQGLILILPLITTPYISRVLGAEKIGIYSYTNSIVQYFILFGSLGVYMYGQREIAYIASDVTKRKKVFWEITLLRFLTFSVAIVIYYFTVVKASEYAIYYKILTLYLIASAFEISWFFQGVEDFKKTVTRNIIVRITSIALVFIFIKTPEDLTKYLLIYSCADLIGNLSLWFYLPKYFKGAKIEKLHIFSHLLPILVLFIPQIAMKVYNIMDKTMLGMMVIDKAELGNYEEAYKIINVLYTIIFSLGLVMMPKIANLYARGEQERLKIYLRKSFNFAFFLTFPMMFGIIAVAKEFIPFFLGKGYDLVVILSQILSIGLVLLGVTNIIGSQYLLPTKRHKEYTLSIVFGIIINIIINALLIKSFKAIGAALATIIAEFFVAIIQIIYVKDEIDIKSNLRLCGNYLFASIIMFIMCYIVGLCIPLNNIVEVMIKMIVGIITYVGLLVLLKDKYLIELQNTVKGLILRKN